MALLSDEERRRVSSEFQTSRVVDPALNKNDVQAAVNAMDEFCDANATQLVAAVPLPARAHFSEMDFKELFLMVLKARMS